MEAEIMNAAKRSMFIIWRWDRSVLDDKLCGAWSVEGTDNDQLFCLNQHYNKDWRKWLISQSRQLLDEDPLHKIFIFIHTTGTGYSKQDGDTLLKDIIDQRPERSSCNYFLFSAGSGAIYLEGSRYGLLGKNGNFKESLLDARLYPDNKDRKILKANHFHKTWLFYEHELRKKCQRLFEEFLIRTYAYPDLVKNDEELPWNIADYLAEHDPDLSNKIKDFMGETTTDQPDYEDTPFHNLASSLEYYGKSVEKAHAQLVESLEELLNHPTGTNVLDQYNAAQFRVRNKFVDLIKVLPWVS